jgi:hypothetical protein
MSTLTATEIVKVIKACKENDVTKLSYGELSLEFDRGHSTKEQFTGYQDESFGVTPFHDTDVVETPSLNDEDSDEQRQLFEDAQDLILSDPVEYEKQIFEEINNRGDE